MRDHDAALDQAIRAVAAILGDALVRLLLANQATRGANYINSLPSHSFRENSFSR